MGKESIHGKDEIMQNYRLRNLENTCLSLKDYLSPGIKALDVGCSIGAVTVDVAKLITPGQVVGIDLEKQAIEEATIIASQMDIDNANFHLRKDRSSISYADGFFDVTYSLNLFAWISDPVAEIMQQKRVTKKGEYKSLRRKCNQPSRRHNPTLSECKKKVGLLSSRLTFYRRLPC